jgi:SAM-dependent methyltransferase
VSAIDLDAFNAFEAEGWQRQAPTYGQFMGRVTARLADPLLDAASVGSGTRLLDVATGPGYIAGRGAERGAHVVGIDVAEAMLDLARSRYPGIEFRYGDAERLPFPDATFDAAVGGFVLHHLGRPERAVAEVARVVAPRGEVAFTVWDEPMRCRLLGILLDAVASAGASPPADLPAGPPIFRFADDAEFTSLLGGAGFSDVVVETLTFTQRIAGGDELWSGLMAGTVRTSPLIQAQPEQVKREIRLHFERLLEEHRAGDGLEVPVSVKLGAGLRAP